MSWVAHAALWLLFALVVGMLLVWLCVAISTSYTRLDTARNENLASAHALRAAELGEREAQLHVATAEQSLKEQEAHRRLAEQALADELRK